MLTAFVLALLAALIVTVVGLFGRWNLVGYSDGMFIAGGIAIAFAILSAFGKWDKQADLVQLDSQLAGEMPLAERSKLLVQDVLRGYNWVVLMSLVGFLLFGLSILIGSFLG